MKKHTLAYTLGTGAASQKNDPYILKADDNISEEDKQLVEDILKSEGDLPNVCICLCS